jgi:hypothetical protein
MFSVDPIQKFLTGGRNACVAALFGTSTQQSLNDQARL